KRGETLTWNPGSKRWGVRANTATRKKAEQVLTLESRPALPRTELTASPAGPVFFDDGKGPPEVRLSGRLFPGRDPAPPGVKLTATVLVNDKKEVAAEIARDGRTWSARVRLVPQQNRFHARLNNGGRAEVLGDQQLTYLRPPRGLRATVPATTAAAVLDLVAQVDSPVPLIAKSVQATVKRPDLFGVKETAVAGAEVTAPPAAGQPWT